MSKEKRPHYYKDVSSLETIDVYRVIELFELHNPCLQHALKKILCAGKRSAKDAAKDVTEAIESLQRWQEMRAEDSAPLAVLYTGPVPEAQAGQVRFFQALDGGEGRTFLCRGCGRGFMARWRDTCPGCQAKKSWSVAP